jgi:hemoglobin
MALYHAIGGMETCRRLARAFYARVQADAVLRAVYPRSLHCVVESLALFLAQHFGGPCEYSAGRWSLSLYEAHARIRIGQAERDAWVKEMTLAMEDVGIGEAARAEMAAFFTKTSTYLIHRPPGEPGEVPAELPFDAAIAAVRRGDVARVAELAADPEFERDPAGWVSLVAVMSGSENPGILDFALERVSADPGLAQRRYTYERTLLHGAASEGCLEMVELLLRLGADPNAADRYGHPPLYCVANACRRGSGAAVVRALAGNGANVNMQDRVKRCAPLHMAARRGNVPVARALLDSGADIGIRDIAGVTPLRRALNCRQPEVAALLRAWAAG